MHGVLFVHGMGVQDSGFSHETRKRLRDLTSQYVEEVQTIKGASKNNRYFIGDNDLEFSDVWWAPKTDYIQSELIDRLLHDSETDKELGWLKFRKFFMWFLGDVLAYQRQPQSRTMYDVIHAEIESGLKNLIDLDSSIQITVVAHSLGTVVASDYLYNVGPYKDKLSPFVPTNFFTWGSPIAIWTLMVGHPQEADQPVQVEQEHGVWVNILDDDDIIGYPLRNINRAYRDAVTLDYITQIGRPLERNSPFSHSKYWTDENSLKPVARKIANDLIRSSGSMDFESEREYLDFIRSI